MGVTREEEIKYKIFNKRNFDDLIEFFLEIDKSIGTEHSRLYLRVNYKDGSSIYANKLIKIDDTKLINSIVFNYSSIMDGIEIEIRVSKDSGYFNVRGEDDDWVIAKFTQLKEIVDAIPKQNKLLSNLTSQIIISFIIPTPFVLLLGLEVLMPIARDPFPVFLITMGILIPSGSFIGSQISKMFPENEFDTTLIHLNKNKLKKKKISFYFMSFITPIVIGILLEIL